MKLPITIESLNKLTLGQVRLMEIGISNNYTPDALLNMGMWNCMTCNNINALESESCEKCDESKFIIRKKYINHEHEMREPEFIEEIRKERISKHPNFHIMRKVRDTSNGKVYESITLAAEKNNYSEQVLKQMLHGERENTSTLKFVPRRELL